MRSLLGKLTEIRTEGRARFKYCLPVMHHEQLDEQFARLGVEIGGCSSVDYAEAMIVSRFCKLLRPKRVLEIGTFRSGMTYHIARNTDEGCRIWTLDLPRELVDDVSGEMIPSDVELARMDPSLVGESWHGTREARKITPHGETASNSTSCPWPHWN